MCGNGMPGFFLLIFEIVLLSSCSTQKQIAKQTDVDFFSNPIFSPAHVGVAIFDPAANKLLYQHQGDKYFIPASNTKLFSLYAGLKYLGDSLVAARYTMDGDRVILQATGDPTFLHPDFKRQPLLNFLQQDRIKKITIQTDFASQPLGRGWAWDDYTADYTAERDPMPVYGDLATFFFDGDSLTTIPSSLKQMVTGRPENNKPWDVDRLVNRSPFVIESGKGTVAKQKVITMSMESGATSAKLLADTLHKEVSLEQNAVNKMRGVPIHSQHVDSLFKIMMHRSDNFFAEQTLQMASSEKLGVMNDFKMIDTLLKTDLKDLPQKPRWVDGSGLSRYNLFSPQDFVWLLNKLKNEFTFERIKVILPGADEGTLAGLYKGYENHIFAKTGTVSNTVALSGYIITKKNRTLIFSILVNSHQATPGLVRKQIEKFLTSMIDKY